MSEIKMLLDGSPLTVAADGTIVGEHEMVALCNLKVQRSVYSPNRQQTAVSLLQRLGAVLTSTESAHQLFAHPLEFDPFIWY